MSAEAYALWEGKTNLLVSLPKEPLLLGKPSMEGEFEKRVLLVYSYASEEEKTFVFFDSNTGIYTFPSLHELAKGVSLYSRSNYGAKQAIHFDAFSI